MEKHFTAHFPFEEMPNLVKLIQAQHAFRYDYSFDKHRIDFLDDQHNTFGYLRLPISMNYKSLTDDTTYLIALIQTGDCAVGIFQNREPLAHKVLKSYLVRKKHGKSQLKYLKTKGKSKAGSRVRLGNAIDFFENINLKITEYVEEYSPERIAISCPKTIWPFLFQSKIECPFAKDDERLYKIPLHVPTPKQEVLLKINRSLQGGELALDTSYAAIQPIAAHLNIDVTS